MRRRSLAAVLVLLSAPPVFGSDNKLSLAGAIDGRLRIHMTLRIANGAATDSYSYDKYGKPIALRGTATADGSVFLDELDAADRPAAQFRGKLSSGNHLDGRWHKTGDTRGLP